MAVGSQILTTEELLAMPDDGITRELIQGELRERGPATPQPLELPRYGGQSAYAARWLIFSFRNFNSNSIGLT